MDETTNTVQALPRKDRPLWTAIGPNVLLLGMVCLVAGAVDYHDHSKWWLLIPGAGLIGLFLGALVDLLIAVAVRPVIERNGNTSDSWIRGLLLGIPFWLLAWAVHTWA